MKKLQKLKLNKLSVEALENREMNQLSGGCKILASCGCPYVNTGGSSEMTVADTNTQYGYTSENPTLYYIDACDNPAGCGFYPA